METSPERHRCGTYQTKTLKQYLNKFQKMKENANNYQKIVLMSEQVGSISREMEIQNQLRTTLCEGEEQSGRTNFTTCCEATGIKTMDVGGRRDKRISGTEKRAQKWTPINT